jgi:hypothetical protein
MVQREMKQQEAGETCIMRSFIIFRIVRSRRMRWAGHILLMGKMRNAYKIFVGKPNGKRPLGGRRRRWENNIKMDLTGMELESADWVHLTQDRGRWRALANTVMNFYVP